MVVIDTNIIIEHLRIQTKSHLDILAENFSSRDLYISMITIQELYQGKSTKDSKKKLQLDYTLAPFDILLYSYGTAKIAGELTRDLKDKYISFADAAIAATCIENQAELATLNIKDFKNVPDLELITLD